MGVDKVRGESLLIKVGNGANPEVFVHPCLINTSRGIKFGSNANKIVIPDCDNPTDPAYSQVLMDGLNAMIDGAGKLDAAAVATYDDWFRSGATKNVQVWLGDKGYWQAGFKLTQWDVKGERNNYCDVTISLESDGTVAAFVEAGA